MCQMDLTKTLFSMRDPDYRSFMAKLLPTTDPDTIMGVRTPDLRKLAKDIAADGNMCGDFLKNLPHGYFEENQLHAFIISQMSGFDRVLTELDRFLPYVDNWATCDQMSPKIFKDKGECLIPKIRSWISSDRIYTIRFGINMLMRYFLGDGFKTEYCLLVANIKSDEYYVKMAQAWYFATALASQYDSALPVLENNLLDVWTHNKTISKAVESRRISPEKKKYLRTLVRRTKQKHNG